MLPLNSVKIKVASMLKCIMFSKHFCVVSTEVAVIFRSTYDTTIIALRPEPGVVIRLKIHEAAYVRLRELFSTIRGPTPPRCEGNPSDYDVKAV